MTCGLTHIRRGAASTREGVCNTRSLVHLDFIFERKKGRDSCKRTVKESNVKMREGCATKAANLSVYLRSVFYSWQQLG